MASPSISPAVPKADDLVPELLSSAIWGNASPGVHHYDLRCYYLLCKRELRQAAVLLPGQPRLESSVIAAIKILKSNPHTPRKELQPLTQYSAVLDLAVRVMLMTASCIPGTINNDIARPYWEAEQTLAQYIGQTYKQSVQPDSDICHQQISAQKLGAGFLKRHAKVEIRWTKRLTDHLTLLKESDWKVVYIFAFPSFLLRSLDALHGKTSTNLEAEGWHLAKGCLPPNLLQETLQSYEIIFPSIGDMLSRDILDREIRLYDLDPAFMGSLQLGVSTRSTGDQLLPPKDLGGLYKRFPFWGKRLHELWKEADDPSPLSYIGRLSDRKKGSRFTYCCAVVAVSIAIMFGVFATVLGCIQVWISYCSWVDDPTVRGCGAGAKHTQTDE